MSEIRAKFAGEFGEEQAAAIETAAQFHANGINSAQKGEPFKWALLICIGYECISREGFRDYHEITVPFDTIKAWIVEHADLASYQGDSDYLSLFCGAYNDFIKHDDRVTA